MHLSDITVPHGAVRMSAQNTNRCQLGINSHRLWVTVSGETDLAPIAHCGRSAAAWNRSDGPKGSLAVPGSSMRTTSY